jgi:hypothetical protein
MVTSYIIICMCVAKLGRVILIIIHMYVVLCCAVPTSMRLWVDSEDVLRFKTGLNCEELEFVWKVVRDALVTHYEQQHAKREVSLLPFASLLATLYWLRLYPTTRCLAAEFDTKHTTVEEDLDHTLTALFNTLVPASFPDSALPHHAYRTGCLAGVKLVVDTTWLTLPHNNDADERKVYYHMKSPTRQGLKWQLVVSTQGEPISMSDVVHGSKADVMLMRESGVLDRLPPHSHTQGQRLCRGAKNHHSKEEATSRRVDGRGEEG